MNSDSYHLVCPKCGTRFDDAYQLACPSGCNALIIAKYSAQQLTVRDLPGMFRYSDWLPVKGHLATKSAPICYQSSGLANELGLNNLWIAFAGFWPEREAYVTSGSFKEFEALPTMVRLAERAKGVILVASAGNTGRAFAEVSSKIGKPVIIVVPAKARERIWTSTPADHLLLVTIDGDYTDAINLGNNLCSLPGIYPEGGAKNIARRDGMGTMMLEGTMAIKHLPDWYIQAVGSGTGGIAAWEASRRLVADGRFGPDLPRLLLIQNDPFTPMVHAFQDGRRDLIHDDMINPKEAIPKVHADVLTNRAPPYGISGGVYDALMATNGMMTTATTDEAIKAGDLFRKTEGIDLDPAAAVCVGGLIKAVKSGVIKPDEKILLAITGGGYERIHRELSIHIHTPDFEVDQNTNNEELMNSVREWVSRYV
ncbi:MAG TPA: cysteate synthase [Methanospirillum sp.]|uniref:cysteate synthase n=1 Tax=Methanospirillum sp. TaxID=45200 RepID=UPI002D10D606|nr:cysteate synthase [Methanospirillum sp.]HWQ63433.1 cysteate synthase [Methanospirillum sp.]